MRYRLGTNQSANSDDLSTHMQVLGSTKRGKSWFLKSLAWQIITNPDQHGLIVIDPHGDLYRSLLNFCSFLSTFDPRIKDRVVLFDPGNDEQVIGFSPFTGVGDSEYRASRALEVFRKVWGQDSFDKTPRLARWLFNALSTATKLNLSLVEMTSLLDPYDNSQRDAAIRKLDGSYLAEEWKRLYQLREAVREDRTESAYGRLHRFLSVPKISRIVGRTENVLDFDEALARRKIILVNLESYANGLIDEQARLLGTMVVSAALGAAFARPEHKRTPTYLMIDEVGEFAPSDLRQILDGGRKFQVPLILAHQHLAQLREHDELLYRSVMTNANMKVVFGGLEMDDALHMAREGFLFDVKRVKDELERTMLIPQEETRTIVSHGHGSGSVEGSSMMLSMGEVSDPNTGIMTPSLTSLSEGEASGSSRASSNSSSRSETTVPFYTYARELELSSRQFYSLEEQLYLGGKLLQHLPQQWIALKLPNKQFEITKVPTLKRVPKIPHQLKRLQEHVYETQDCYIHADALRAVDEAVALLSSPCEDELTDEGLWGDSVPQEVTV